MMESSPQRLEVTHTEGRTVVRFEGCPTLDYSTMEVIGPRLSELADPPAGPHVLLNLEGVDFLSSTALSRLIGLTKSLKARGGKLTLFNVRPDVRDVFAVTRLDHLMEIAPAGDDRARPTEGLPV